MATRIHLPSSGAAPVTPSTWNHANQAASTYTCAGVLTKGTTALTSRTTASGTTNPYTRAVMRYVIGRLAAVEISGTVNAVMLCSEQNAAANATMSIAVKIIKPDGTDRSVLLAAIASDKGGGVEEFTTTLSSRRAYNVTETRPIPLTAQTPTEGDYLVIELGFRSASGTSYNVVMRHGDNSASDLADSDGATDAYAPWVEFSQTLTFMAHSLACDAGSYGLTGQAMAPLKGSKVAAAAGSYALTGQAAGVRRAARIFCGGGLAGWHYRKLIALPIPTANLTDFPVEVPIIADAEIGAACLASGYDIRFTAADGVTLLSYERESWSGGGGSAVTAIFWVKTNVATAGTYIWCYFGNAAAADVSTTVRDPEFVANGGFDANTDGWSTSDCSILSIAGGQKGNCLELTMTGGAIQYARQDVGAVLTVGLTYRISGYAKSGSSGTSANNFALIYFDYNWANATQLNGTTAGSWAKVSFTKVATTTAFHFFFQKNNATAGTMLFDNASCKIFHSTEWSAYEDAQELLADGGLTWGEGEIQGEPGSYALTGAAIGLRRAAKLSAGSGAYALTGVATGLLRAARLNAEAGAYVLTGKDANLLANRLIAAGAGAYVITGAVIENAFYVAPRPAYVHVPPKKRTAEVWASETTAVRPREKSRKIYRRVT